MMKQPLAASCAGSALLAAALLFSAAAAPAAGFDLPGFQPGDPVLLQGGAVLEGGRVRLTPALPAQRGALWQASRRFVSGGFQTQFQFQMARSGGAGTPGGEGFAFVLQNNAAPALGPGGDGLGYDGVRYALAVEFDTRWSESRNDPSGNHVSVQLRRAQPATADHSASLASASEGVPDLADGLVHTARIQCAQGVVEVFVDDLARPLLSAPLPAEDPGVLPLDELLGLADGQAWAGFTAANGPGAQTHEILNWSFAPAASPLQAALAAPLEGAAFPAATRITLEAAVQATSQVVRVEFYQGIVKLGQATASPWVFSWKDALPGACTLTAAATDDTGRRTVSDPVQITVFPSEPPIGLHFSSGTNGNDCPLSYTDAAGQVSQRVWNNGVSSPDGSGVLYSLRNGAGTVTPARASWDFAAPGEDPGFEAVSGPARLAKSAVMDGPDRGPGITNSLLTVSQIPFGVYDVLVYSSSAHGGTDTVAEFRLRSQSIFLREAAWTDYSGAWIEAAGTLDQGPLTPAGNYVCFRGLTNSSFTLAVTARSTTGQTPQAALNGIQIVPSLNVAPPAIVRGPYLQMVTPTSAIVRWRTSRAADSRLRFGLSASSLSATNDDTALAIDHLVTLTNLQPATRYYYAVGTTESNLLASPDCYITTHPTNPVPTRVWFISDYGFRSAGERSVRDFYFTNIAPVKPADVWITGGDNDQTDGTDAHDQDAIFGTNYAYGALLRNHAIWPTPGNHDYQTAQAQAFYANFSLPTQGEAGGVPSGSEHYYSFNHGDVHLISLDSIDESLSASSDTPMTRWLRQDLAAATQTWIIAYWHGGPYTKGTHDSDSDTDTLAWMVRMRQNILPILEAAGVDLVLCGHSHVYERSWPIQGHYGYSWAFNETNKIDAGDGRPEGTGPYLKAGRGPGTVYVTAAIGGQPQTDRFPGEKHPAHFLKIADTFGSVVLDINGPRLDFQCLGLSGAPLDTFSITKDLPSTPPAAPENLAAGLTPQGLSLLTWSNTPVNEMSFKLERSLDGAAFQPLETLAANRTQYVDISLPPGTPALYRLRAWNPAGDSAYSAVALAGLGDAPRVSSILCSNGLVTVTWFSQPNHDYELMFTADLAHPAWDVIGREIRADGYLTRLVVAAPPGQPAVFFRVRDIR